MTENRPDWWQPEGCPVAPDQPFGYRHICPEHPALPTLWERVLAWLRRQHVGR